MPFVCAVLLSLPLTILLQAEQDKPLTADVLGPAERQALSSANNISSRTKIYLEAAGRRLRAAEGKSGADDPWEMTKHLESYRQILELCKAELSQLPSQQRKDLKRQEITLRRYLTTLSNMEAKVGIDDRKPIQDAMQLTKGLRAAFLSTFFGSGVLKRP